MKNKTIIIATLIFVGVTLIFLYDNGKKNNPPPIIQPEKIDEYVTVDDTPKDVAFCGKNYRAKQIIFDGVDVIQRISKIINEMNSGSNEDKQFATAVCENIKLGITADSLDELQISGPAIRDDDYSKYYIGVGRFLVFSISYPSLQIELSKAEEGTSTVIGVLK